MTNFYTFFLRDLNIKKVFFGQGDFNSRDCFVFGLFSSCNFKKWRAQWKKKKIQTFESKYYLWELTTKHKTVNIVNEVNFKIVIDERIRKYCRGGGKNILVCITKQARIINKYLKRKAWRAIGEKLEMEGKAGKVVWVNVWWLMCLEQSQPRVKSTKSLRKAWFFKLVVSVCKVPSFKNKFGVIKKTPLGNVWRHEPPNTENIKNDS